MSLRFAFSILVSFGMATCICACANPLASIQPDIDRFKREFPQQIETVRVEAKNVHFAWSGDPQKRPLVFVHGSPGSWEGWAHFLLDEKLQKNFHLIAIDRFGYGGSQKGTSEPSLGEQAKAIAAALRSNRSGMAAILVGHSYGGPVVARGAMDYPQQVGGVVFVASSVAPDLEETKWIQYPASWWPIRALIPGELRVCNEEILALKAELQKILPRWQELTAKAAIVHGEVDDLVPPQNVDFLISHLSRSNLVQTVRVSDLNHFVPWKRPELIISAIYAVELSLTNSKQIP